MSTRAMIRRAYLGVAVFWLNLTVLCVVVNAGALAYLALAGRASPAPAAPSVDPKSLRQFFPDLDDQELAEFVRESTHGFQYEPFTQFRETPYVGRWVTIDEAGFRHGRDQGPWPPERASFNVFVFGGSTTFGYGVPDDSTVPSYLALRLERLGLPRPPRVYNFGRGGYYSSQERVLFEKLLVAGVVPDMAIFIDGLNDFFFKDGEPALTPWLTQAVAQHGAPSAPAYETALAALPITRALGLTRAAATLGGYPAPPQTAARAPERYDDPAVLQEVIRRWRVNQRLTQAAAREFGVQAVFVWQPVPTYKYHGPAGAGLGVGFHEYSRFGYPLMAEARRTEPLARNFLWCADLQEGLSGPLYVDSVHYTPAMSSRVADCIVEGLKVAGLMGEGADGGS